MKWDEAPFLSNCGEFSHIRQVHPSNSLLQKRTIKTLSSREGRNPITIIARPHGEGFTVRAQRLHSMGSNYRGPHITFLLFLTRSLYISPNNSITKVGFCMLQLSERERGGDLSSSQSANYRAKPCTVETSNYYGLCLQLHVNQDSPHTLNWQ